MILKNKIFLAYPPPYQIKFINILRDDSFP